MRSYPQNCNGGPVSSTKNNNSSPVVDRENGALQPPFKTGVPGFHKASHGDSKKDSRKASCSSDTNAQDNKKKHKETKGGWFDAATFMEWVRKVLVAEVHPKQNEYGSVVLIVDGSKIHITPSNIMQTTWSRGGSPASPVN